MISLCPTCKYRPRSKPGDKCRECRSEYQRQQRAKQTGIKYTTQYYRNLRETVLMKYGGKCACCGEARKEFLAIDHEAGNGNQHRRQLKKTNTHMIFWLRREGYPEGFRVLCHNCNMARGFYGYCPHEISKSEAGVS